jgi:hypothetical protein
VQYYIAINTLINRTLFDTMNILQVKAMLVNNVAKASFLVKFRTFFSASHILVIYIFIMLNFMKFLNHELKLYSLQGVLLKNDKNIIVLHL